ncbi:TetR/AcrR family transcriptional regulator [Nocardia sp. NPDC051833]|uniref:TetR/AcrR family transcriptional regulator n=1 Tax=Nocardia sp. NPDC051833 TaxID=3155674 RepID=UPI00341A2B77
MTQLRTRCGTRGRYAKSEAKREAILTAALQVFAESGYAGGTLRNVAEHVGISPANIFHHFADKQALLLAVLEQRDEWARTVAFRPGDFGLLLGIIDLADALSHTPELVRVYVMLVGEATSPAHPAYEHFRSRRNIYRDLLAERFALAAERGIYRGKFTPADAASSVIALLDGVQLQWTVQPDAVDMADIMRTALGALIDFDALRGETQTPTSSPNDN